MQCNSCVHNGVMHEDPLELCEVCENYYCSDCRYDYLRKDWGRRAEVALNWFLVY